MYTEIIINAADSGATFFFIIFFFVSFYPSSFESICLGVCVCAYVFMWMSVCLIALLVYNQVNRMTFAYLHIFFLLSIVLQSSDVRNSADDEVFFLLFFLFFSLSLLQMLFKEKNVIFSRSVFIAISNHFGGVCHFNILRHICHRYIRCSCA